MRFMLSTLIITLQNPHLTEYIAQFLTEKKNTIIPIWLLSDFLIVVQIIHEFSVINAKFCHISVTVTFVPKPSSRFNGLTSFGYKSVSFARNGRRHECQRHGILFTLFTTLSVSGKHLFLLHLSVITHSNNLVRCSIFRVPARSTINMVHSRICRCQPIWEQINQLETLDHRLVRTHRNSHIMQLKIWVRLFRRACI